VAADIAGWRYIWERGEKKESEEEVNANIKRRGGAANE
jgi:hypothetical protein